MVWFSSVWFQGKETEPGPLLAISGGGRVANCTSIAQMYCLDEKLTCDYL